MHRETKQKVAENEKAFLGISGRDVAEEVSMAYNLPRGVYVIDIVENTGAAEAGIQNGDIIVAFEGEEITQMAQLQELLEYYAAGTSVEITIMRQSDNGYQEQVITVVLGYKTE